MEPPITNIAALFERSARRLPDKDAVIEARRRGGGFDYRRTTFAELRADSERLAAGLASAGVTRGMRTIVLVKPGRELFALTFALFRLGAVPVLIDPGIGVRNMVRCLGSVAAPAFVAIAKGHVLRLLFPGAFRSCRILVTVGGVKLWGGHSLARLAVQASLPAPPLADTALGETAAILFTSGSTGAPKGVVYRHETFLAQVGMLESEFGFTADEIDVATFPLFALFDAALGVTCVIPDMDATRPGSVRGENVTGPIRELGATSMFGSPALLERALAAPGVEPLPTLRRVISAGAPVHRRILEGTQRALPAGAVVFTPYGATEALPVAIAGSDELLGDDVRTRSAAGCGVCVGRPVAGVTVRVVGITDEPIATWSEELALPPGQARAAESGSGLARAAGSGVGQVGEIVVKGAVVTREYLDAPAATALAKIRDGDGVWHRMGDLGSFDELGRLWFAGRKAHRVQTSRGVLFTVAVETVFNAVAGVRRTALVGVGAAPSQEPVLCVELLRPRQRPWSEVEAELRALAASNPAAGGVAIFLEHPSFPVDIRHNAKIFREQLAVWAARRLGRRR